RLVFSTALEARAVLDRRGNRAVVQQRRPVRDAALRVDAGGDARATRRMAIGAAVLDRRRRVARLVCAQLPAGPAARFVVRVLLPLLVRRISAGARRPDRDDAVVRRAT